MAFSKQVKDEVLSYLMISLGTFMYCFAWAAFMIPNGMSSGGLTGVCTLIQFATNGLITVDSSYMVINVVLLLIAFMVLGKGFGFKTIYCILLATVLFRIIPHWESVLSVEGNFLFIPEKILIPIIAGIIEGTGLGIIFVNGGSSGGSDIIVVIVNKYWPVSMSRMFVYMDLFVIAAIMLLPGRTFGDALYGYIMLAAFSVMFDFVIVGRQSSVKVLVFSEKYADIADYLNTHMDRGVTALNAMGWYTKTDKKVLLCVMKKKQLHDVTKMIKQIDPKAFVSVSPATSVYGEGFEEIKTGLPKKADNS